MRDFSSRFDSVFNTWGDYELYAAHRTHIDTVGVYGSGVFESGSRNGSKYQLVLAGTELYDHS